jgi:predicted Zn-dependent protease
LITTLEHQGRQEEVVSVINSLIEQTGANEPLLVLSEYHGRNGDFDQAFELLAKPEAPVSIAQTRLFKRLYLAKANEAMVRAELGDGRQTILEGLTAYPNNPRLLALLINIEIRANQFDEAEEVLKALVKIIPDRPLVAILGGDIALAKKHFTLAYERYLIAWQAHPTDQVASKIYDTLFQQSKDDGELVVFLDDWQRRLPESRLAELTRAGYHMQQGELDSAKRRYEALLSESDDLAVAHNNLAWIYGEGDLSKALAAGKRAYELAPDSAEIIDTYAWFLYKNGDLSQAKVLLVKAVGLAPDNEKIRQHLIEVTNRT